MPNYYNPYMSAYPIGYAGYNQPIQQQVPQQPQYMINVDGEVGAKSWQPSVAPTPNTVIPLFDLDGEHVYFRSYDAYGRMNPMRKGKIVFVDEPQNTQTATQSGPAMEASGYVTKEEFDRLLKEVQDLKQRQNNQNGNNNRGEKR